MKWQEESIDSSILQRAISPLNLNTEHRSGCLEQVAVIYGAVMLL